MTPTGGAGRRLVLGDVHPSAATAAASFPVALAPRVDALGPLPYRPDAVADGWRSGGLEVRAASVRGDAHRRTGTPRQDDVVVLADEAGRRVIVAVADGVSSASLSHIGASTACRYAAERLLRSRPPYADGWVDLFAECGWGVVEASRRAAGADDADPQRAEAEMATTLCVAVVTERDGANVAVEAAVVGDPAVAVVGPDGGLRYVLGGKRRSDEVVDPSVVPLPRMAEPVCGAWTLAPGETLVLGSDGLWDPVGDGTGPVGAPLVAMLTDPLPTPSELLHLLDFYRETHDDDRTVVVVARGDGAGRPGGTEHLGDVRAADDPPEDAEQA